ncbi:MAG: sulfur carrier protein ThiS [Bacteroidetes bacterium]|jgi:sulfur carrier protein|nr:sulfur carrier protein ThiS [Bacteroidota bacterium]
MSVSEAEIALTLNGDATTLPEGATVADALRAEGIDPEDARGIAVAVNAEVIRKEAWTTTSLNAGDDIEIVTASQGG